MELDSKGSPATRESSDMLPTGQGSGASHQRGEMHFLARRAVVWFYTNWRLLSFRGALQQPSRQRRVKLKSLKNLRPSGPSTLKPHRGLSIRRRGLCWRPSGADFIKKGLGFRRWLCRRAASHRENDSLHFVRRSAPSKCVRCASLSLRSAGETRAPMSQCIQDLFPQGV